MINRICLGLGGTTEDDGAFSWWKSIEINFLTVEILILSFLDNVEVELNFDTSALILPLWHIVFRVLSFWNLTILFNQMNQDLWPSYFSHNALTVMSLLCFLQRQVGGMPA